MDGATVLFWIIVPFIVTMARMEYVRRTRLNLDGSQSSDPATMNLSSLTGEHDRVNLSDEELVKFLRITAFRAPMK